MVEALSSGGGLSSKVVGSQARTAAKQQVALGYGLRAWAFQPSESSVQAGLVGGKLAKITSVQAVLGLVLLP